MLKSHCRWEWLTLPRDEEGEKRRIPWDITSWGIHTKFASGRTITLGILNTEMATSLWKMLCTLLWKKRLCISLFEIKRMIEHTTKKNMLQVSRHDQVWTSYGWTKNTSLKLGAHNLCIFVYFTLQKVWNIQMISHMIWKRIALKSSQWETNTAD